MTLCSDVVGYQRFGGPWCLHLLGEVFIFSNCVGVLSVLRYGRFNPEEDAIGTHWIGSGEGLRVGLGLEKKKKFQTLQGTEPRPFRSISSLNYLIPTARHIKGTFLMESYNYCTSMFLVKRI
jgi:hypothetical protein